MTSLKNSIVATLAILVSINSSIVASDNPAIVAALSSAVSSPTPADNKPAELVSILGNFELNATNVMLISALAASLIRFWTREGDNNPSRFDWDKIAAGQDIANQSLCFVDDEIIGHSGKGSYQMADPKTGGTKFSTPVEPKGLFGYISAYHKAVIKALGAAWLTAMVIKVLSENHKKEQFFKALGKELNQLGEYTKLPKYANIGAGLLIGAYLTA